MVIKSPFWMFLVRIFSLSYKREHGVLFSLKLLPMLGFTRLNQLLKVFKIGVIRRK